MQDKEDDGSVVDTALREAKEEINLERDQVTVVSVLPPFVAVYNNVIAVHVVVCVLQASRSELSLSANSEVEKIFWAPLELFVTEENHWEKTLPYNDTTYASHFFGYTVQSTGERFIIWGLTSRICVALASIVLQVPIPFTFSANVLVRKELNDGKEWEMTTLRTPFCNGTHLPSPTSKL